MKINMRKTTNDLDVETVYVKDFGDNYHRSDYDPSDELTQQALKIRRVYKRQSDYRYAVAIFNEYFARIVDKYGGPKEFRIAMIAQTMTDFLPPIPKLKSKKYGNFYKKGIVVSEANLNKMKDQDILDAIAEMDVDYEAPIYLAGNDEKVKGYKKIEDLIDKVSSTTGNMLNNSRDISLLEAYFAKRHKEEEDQHNKNAESITLTQLLSDEFYEILESYENADDTELVTYSGKLMTRKQINQLEIINELYKLGWNTTKLLNAMDGDNSLLDITKNERKLSKKAEKRRKKAESYLSKLASDNKFSSFDAFEQGISTMGDESIFDRFRD